MQMNVFKNASQKIGNIGSKTRPVQMVRHLASKREKRWHLEVLLGYMMYPGDISAMARAIYALESFNFVLRSIHQVCDSTTEQNAFTH